MAAVKHQGDEVAHTLIDQLNKTFITPFDREDFHALAKEVDAITDMLTEAGTPQKLPLVLGWSEC